jgi:hypothetical protein
MLVQDRGERDGLAGADRAQFGLAEQLMDFGGVVKRAPHCVNALPRAVAERQFTSGWRDLQIEQGANRVLDAFKQGERLGDQAKASAVKIVAKVVDLSKGKDAKVEGHKPLSAVALAVAGALGEGDYRARQARLRFVRDWISGKRSHDRSFPTGRWWLEPVGSWRFQSACHSGIKDLMTSQQTLIPQKKKRGPAPTGQGTPVMVRLQPRELAALDKHIAEQSEQLTRPEAIRRILTEKLDSTHSRCGNKPLG